MRIHYIIFYLLFSIVSSAQVKFKNSINEVKPIEIGQKIKNSTLIDKEGINYNLNDLVTNKKSIFIIYRGGWCPYCNEHLGDIAEIEPKLIALGYKIYAVSPDSPEALQNTDNQDTIKYKLLSDSDGDFIHALGVGYKVKSGLKKGIKSLFYKIKNNFLPVPSLFIVDGNSTVLYKYISSNYKERISNETLLSEAEKYNN